MWLPSIASGINVWLSTLDSERGVLHNLNSSTEPINVWPKLNSLPLVHALVVADEIEADDWFLILPWNPSLTNTSNESKLPLVLFTVICWYSSLKNGIASVLAESGPTVNLTLASEPVS